MRIQDTIKINGQFFPYERDATAEEEAEMLAYQQTEIPQEKTAEERIAELEEAIEALLSGRTK